MTWWPRSRMSALLNNQLKAQYDSGVYVVLATSLSMGQGYRDIFVLGDPPHTKYPPVFPLLLAPFIHAFGYNVVLLKLMVIAMAVSALYVLYRLYADEGDQGMPLVLALAAATSPGVVFFSQSVMTEVPYLLLSLLALLALHRYSPPASGAALAIIAGLVSLAYLTRLVGLSLLVAAVAYLLCEGGAPTRSARRRDAIVIGLLAAVPAAAWFLRSWWVGESAAPVYLSEFNIERAWSSPTSPGGMLDIARRASGNIVRYAGHVGRVIFFYAPPGVADIPPGAPRVADIARVPPVHRPAADGHRILRLRLRGRAAPVSGNSPAALRRSGDPLPVVLFFRLPRVARRGPGSGARWIPSCPP